MTMLLTAARTHILLLMLSSLLGLIGCLNEFPLATEPVDSGTDSNPTDDTEYLDSTPSDADTMVCPAKLTFATSIQYSEVAQTDREGAEYFDTCPEGQVLVGFEGFLRPAGTDEEAHGKIRGICGIPSIQKMADACEVQIEEGDVLPVRASDGEIQWSRMCPKDLVITGFKAWFGHNIYSLVLRCAPLLISENGGGYSISLGFPVDLDSIGTQNGVNFLEEDCPAGQIATGTNVKTDHLLRAFALGCQTPDVEQ